MTIQIKESGPPGVARPFRPTIEVNSKLSTDERMTEALEHIAVSLSAIDHNLEALTSAVGALLKVQAQRK